MEKHTARNNFYVIILGLLMTFQSLTVMAQTRKEVFMEIQSKYQRVSLPATDLSNLEQNTTLDAKLLNKLLFDLQEGKASHYVNDTLFRIPHGRISDEPFVYSDSKEVNGEWVDFEVTFPINVYAIGQIDFGNNFVGLITRVVDFMVDYIDIYLFDSTTGSLKSIVFAFEAEYTHNGHPEEGYKGVYNTSVIDKDKKIKWHQVRYGVTTDRIFDVSPDGFFRVIYQKSKGEFEY